MTPHFKYLSLGLMVLFMWAGVFAARLGYPVHAFAYGVLVGFFAGGLVYAAIYRRAIRHEVREAIKDEAAKSRKLFDEANRAQLERDRERGADG